MKNGFPAATCFVFLRLHTCTSLDIRVGDVSFGVSNRSIGVLTGTRSAAAAGRIPFLDVARIRVKVWSDLAFKTPTRTFALATFVDNLFSTGESIADVVAILDDAGNHLSQRWHLKIGIDSKKLLPAAGAKEEGQINSSWKVVKSMKCLGHILSQSSRFEEDFSEAVRHVWGSYYANTTAGFYKASVRDRLKFLQTCVKPAASFKWTKWPYTPTLAGRLDQLQRHLVGNALRICPRSSESWEAFRRRRHTITHKVTVETGMWSNDWKNAIIAWEQHIERPSDRGNWSKPAYDYHGAAWMLEQRLAHGYRNSFARTSTRAIRGKPAKRWFEGLDGCTPPPPAPKPTADTWASIAELLT